RNPVTAYRFGTHLDEGYFHFVNRRAYSRSEWEALNKDVEEFKKIDFTAADPLPPEFWRAWLVPTQEYKAKVEWTEQRTRMFKELDAYNWNQVGDGKTTRLLAEGGLCGGTNLFQSLSDVLNRELKNQVQGIIVVSDGRTNLGSAEVLEDL